MTYQIFPDRFRRTSVPDVGGMVGRRWVHDNWSDQPVFLPDEQGQITNRDFFGGSLAGITEKLDYLKSLSVSTLYLNPIFEADSNHRYNTADYHAIDPLLGSEEDFRTLCREAHARGIHIILDGVFNHTGSNSRYFNAEGFYPEPGAAQSTESPYFNWYSFHPWPTDYDAWWGVHTLPAVNEEQPDYRRFIISGKNSVVRHWLRDGADGWRLDVADEWLKVSPAEGTGEDTFSIVSVGADVNPSTYYRYSVFSLESAIDTTVYRYSQQIWAEQQGNTGTSLTVSCEVPLRVSASAASETFTVETNAPKFDLRTDVDWLQATASGNEVTFSVEANTTEDVRVGYIYFDTYRQEWQSSSPTIYTYYLEVRQESPEYSLSESSLAFRNTAGTKTVTLYCDLGWTASTTDSWIQVSPSSGSAGTVELSVSVTENGGVEERSGAVNLHVDGDFLIEIPVKQSGLYMDMTESRFDFESGAASRTVSMSTNLSFWNVLEKPSWVSVSPESGEAGEHTLTINVEDNPNTTKREGRPARFSDGCKILQFRTSGQPPFFQSATSGAQFSSSISFRQLASASLCFC